MKHFAATLTISFFDPRALWHAYVTSWLEPSYYHDDVVVLLHHNNSPLASPGGRGGDGQDELAGGS